MIEKKEENPLSNGLAAHDLPSSHSTIEKLAQSQQLIELTYSQIQSEIRDTFERLVEALRSREKQLIRQVDVLQSQHIALLQSNQLDCNEGSVSSPSPAVNVDLSNEKSLVESIMNFGKVDVEGGNLAAFDQYSAPYRIEEYQSMKEDHVNLYKSLSQDMNSEDVIKFNIVPQLKHVAHSKSNEIALPCSETPSVSPLQRHSISGLECNRHTPHVQQWLKQIMVETETEPTVGEIEKKITSFETTD